MLILPRAILFDMDGTLTEPFLDFDRIRRDMGIGDGPILEALHALDGRRRRDAEAALHRHEENAAANSTLNPGCRGLLEWIEAAGIGTALITRNTRRSVEAFFARHKLHCKVWITREDGRFKPDPSPLLEACRRLSVKPTEAWMVGDGQFDVEAGNAAGARSVWVSHGRAKPFAAEPWKIVRDLVELREVLRAFSSAR